MRLVHWGVICAMLAYPAAVAHASEPRFNPLPNYGGYNESLAFGISDDGHVIVGQGYHITGPQSMGAVRWTNGVVDQPSGGGVAEVGFGVSADGSIIAGGNSGVARWSAGTGWSWFATGYGGGMDVSGDGRTLVGYALGQPSGFQAVRWTAEDGLQSLGRVNGAANAAYAVNADGSVIVGGSTDGGPSFIWTRQQGISALPGLPDAFTSRALAINRSGTIVVGSLNSANGYLWENGSVTQLGFGEPWAVTDNGDAVYGDGFAWTRANGYEPLNQFFTRLDILPAGWGQLFVTDVTPDGGVIVGSGTNPQGLRQAFYAVVPDPAGAVGLLPVAGLLLARGRRLGS
jgi:uncharacterized membrane protein